jgi:predicted flap endonuclease-1-like 5' DNA nuclease
MAYNVEEIEGVGKTYGNRLAALGITTTNDLLEKGGTKAGRQKIAEATDIPESLVLTWVNHADLMRIDGVAGHYSELLEASGVDTVKELATRNAENLQAKMHEVNIEYGLTKKVPSGELVKSMINQAKTLEQKVFH